MDIKSEVIEIIDELFMEDVSDMMDEDLFDAGVLDSMGTVELIVEIENRFDIRVPVTEFGRDDWNTANKIVAGITRDYWFFFLSVSIQVARTIILWRKNTLQPL